MSFRIGFSRSWKRGKTLCPFSYKLRRLDIFRRPILPVQKHALHFHLSTSVSFKLMFSSYKFCTFIVDSYLLLFAHCFYGDYWLLYVDFGSGCVHEFSYRFNSSSVDCLDFTEIQSIMVLPFPSQFLGLWVCNCVCVCVYTSTWVCV